MLTRIFQQKMKEADAAAQAMKGAQAKEHRKELRALQEACEVHLADAAQKIKDANLANKDAIAIAAKNKKLEVQPLPLPNAPCPMPNAQRPMPNAQCPMPNAQCPCPCPNAQMPTARCRPMPPNAECPMPNAKCPMPNA